MQQAEDGSWVPDTFWDPPAGGDLAARVRRLEEDVANRARQREGAQLNLRDLVDCHALRKVADGQVAVYSKALGAWEPGDVGGGTPALTGLRFAAAATDALSTGVTGDTTDRFVLDADGTMHVGTGVIAPTRALWTSADSVALGRGAMPGSAAFTSVAIGVSALAVMAGSECVAVGSYALVANTTGAQNTAVGRLALDTTTTANKQVGVGFQARCGAGDSAIAVGYQASATGNNALAIGRGTTASGAGAVAIGRDSGGTGAVATATNLFVLGTSSHLVRVDGTVELLGHATVAGSGKGLAFYGGSPQLKAAVTGSRAGNAALASLLTTLATMGLITNSTSA